MNAEEKMKLKGFEPWPTSYSNFDHKEPKGAEEAMRAAGEFYVEHPAWDHWGVIWFEDGKFHEIPMVYRAEKEPVSGDTLRDVFDEVNSRYGAD